MATSERLNLIPDHGPDVNVASEATWFALNGNTAKFSYQNTDGVASEVSEVMGVFEEMFLEWDAEGNPEHDVPPRWEINVMLTTREYGLVQIIAGSAVGLSTLIEGMAAFEPGTVVSCNLAKGKKSTYCNVWRWTGENWIENRKKLTSGTALERYAQAIALARKNKGFNHAKSDPPRPGDLDFDQGANASGAVPVTGPVSTSAQDIQAERTRAGIAAQAPASTGIPAVLPKVFGWQVPRVPTEAQWAGEANETQLQLAQEKCARAGLEGLASVAAGVIVRQIGEPDRYLRSKGAVMLLVDFLSSAPPDACHELVRAASYDPFADE